MKFLSLILFISLNYSLLAQNVNFAFVSDIKIGSENSESVLKELVKSINENESLNFLVINGNITERGKNLEFEKAYNLLKELKTPYYFVPGKSDTRYIESAGLKIIELWEDDKFYFEKDSTAFIGLNPNLLWIDSEHFDQNSFNWIKENISSSIKQIVFFVPSNSPKEIKNYNELLKIFSEDKKLKLFASNFEGNKNDIINGRYLVNNKKTNWGYNICEVKNDSLKISEVINNDTTIFINNFIFEKIKFVKIKVSQDSNTEIIFEYNLNSTLKSNITIYENKIYTADYLGLVSCIDTTGSIIWEFDAFGNIISSPIIADNILAISTIQGDLITLNAETGESIQTIGFDDVLTSKLLLTEYTGNKSFMIPKETESKAAIILGTSSGTMYCYDLETLQQIWVNKDSKSLINSSPVIFEKKLIYASMDGYLYCLDSENGLLLWKWKNDKNNSTIICKPVSNGKEIFITMDDKKVYSIDLLLGRTVWENNKLNAWESIGINNAQHRVFVKSKYDKFHIISAKTSNWVKEINIKFGEDKIPTEIVEIDNNILFGCADGNIYKIDSKFKTSKLFNIGSSPIYTIQKFSEDILAVANYDGKIILFRLK